MCPTKTGMAMRTDNLADVIAALSKLHVPTNEGENQ